jgi:hypothetical protein
MTWLSTMSQCKILHPWTIFVRGNEKINTIPIRPSFENTSW